jgi:hypothetical protein
LTHPRAADPGVYSFLGPVGRLYLMGSAADLALSAKELKSELIGARFNATEVLAATAKVERDGDGEDAIFILIVLSDPAGDTWPNDDILDLRRAVIRMAIERELEVPIYVTLSPHSDQPQEDDELTAEVPTLF